MRRFESASVSGGQHESRANPNQSGSGFNFDKVLARAREIEEKKRKEAAAQRGGAGDASRPDASETADVWH